MKNRLLIVSVAGLCLCGVAQVAVSEDAGAADQKAKVTSLLQTIKEKSKEKKRPEYKIALPVATAGARGAEVKQRDRFAAIWPDSGISPLTALAENVKHGVAHDEKPEAIRAQIDEFKKLYPEFVEDQLMKDLEAALPAAK